MQFRRLCFTALTTCLLLTSCGDVHREVKPHDVARRVLVVPRAHHRMGLGTRHPTAAAAAQERAVRTLNMARVLLGEAAQQRTEAARQVVGAPDSGSNGRRAASGFMPCGGTDYPPCYVAQRESGNTYTAYNPSGCGGNGCFGRWQFSGAWACKLGLPCDLADATPSQQDNAARELWNHGAGCSNWGACG